MAGTCETCTHFRRHYVKFGRGYLKTNDGHCVYPRRKLRRGSTPACEHFKEAEPKETK